MRRFIRAWAMTTIAVLWPICVSAQVADNDQVAHKIHDVLKASGRMSGSSFVIKCQDGTACLEGRVGSDEQKALALKLTGEVPEVNEVVDHLRVESSKKAVNPVVRLLSAPFTKPPAGNEQELPPVEEDDSPLADDEKPSSFASWFKHPAVHVAKAPRPQARRPVPADVTPNEKDTILPDDGSVYPEELAESQPSDPRNMFVRQAANLRAIFSRHESSAKSSVSPVSQAAPQNPAPVAASQVNRMSQQVPRPMATVKSECAACEGRVVTSAPQSRVTPVAHVKRYRQASPAPGVSQSQPQPTTAGRVRMVPMIELADGSLVPVEQARRSPSAQPTTKRGSTANRTRAVASSRSRQSVARKQEVIEGPLDVEPAVPMQRGPVAGGPLPSYVPGTAVGVAPAYYDQPHMPNYAWPSYAAHPNYAGLTYPRQYSPTAWPYIGPFYPYPQVPLGWRKVTLEWDDGWWFLDFDDTNRSYAY
jgi:hypothetical protein